MSNITICPILVFLWFISSVNSIDCTTENTLSIQATDAQTTIPTTNYTHDFIVQHTASVEEFEEEEEEQDFTLLEFEGSQIGTSWYDINGVESIRSGTRGFNTSAESLYCFQPLKTITRIAFEYQYCEGYSAGETHPYFRLILEDNTPNPVWSHEFGPFSNNTRYFFDHSHDSFDFSPIQNNTFSIQPPLNATALALHFKLEFVNNDRNIYLNVATLRIIVIYQEPPNITPDPTTEPTLEPTEFEFPEFLWSSEVVSTVETTFTTTEGAITGKKESSSWVVFIVLFAIVLLGIIAYIVFRQNRDQWSQWTAVDTEDITETETDVEVDDEAMVRWNQEALDPSEWSQEVHKERMDEEVHREMQEAEAQSDESSESHSD